MVSSTAKTIAQYLDALPPERRAVVAAVRDLVNRYIPSGYVESMNFGMIAWEIPLARYPVTYNKQPLMYAALAAQKNAYSLYLLCAHMDSGATDVLKAAYAAAGRKLDMGGSCLRFKRFEDLLTEPIARLIGGSSVEDHIARYEAGRKKPSK
jgi:hypothetical protein